jgi:DNA-binding GntR family transcriptional regulator
VTAGLERLGGERATLAAQALDGLRSAVVDGRLAPGERYSVGALAERLGVSRTPVREALLVLEREGLVRFERNKGVRIIAPSAADLEEVFALRLLLEVPATRRACARLAGADLDALDAALDAMAGAADAGDELGFMAQDQRFHALLLAAAGSPRLVAVVGRLRDHVRLLGASTAGRSRDLRAIHAEHVAIRDALRARDADGAAAAMRAHLRATGELLAAQEGAPPPDLDWALRPGGR